MILMSFIALFFFFQLVVFAMYCLGWVWGVVDQCIKIQ